jgi:hypothetical protein
MRKKRNAYGIMVGKPAVKSLLGRPRRRWEDNKELVLKKKFSRARIELIWPRIGKSDGLLCRQKRNLGLLKIW